MIEDDPLIKQAISEIGEPPPRPRRYWANKKERIPTDAAVAYEQRYKMWECEVLGRAVALRERMMDALFPTRKHPAPPDEQEAQR